MRASAIVFLLFGLSISQIGISQNTWDKLDNILKSKVDEALNNLSQFKTENGWSYRLLSKSTDKLGVTHGTWQKTYKGIPMSYSDVKTHWKANQLRINGPISQNEIVSIEPGISSNDAISSATKHIGAKRYMWENARSEAMLKRTSHDENATHRPKPQLKLYDFGGEIVLIWELEIFALLPHSRDIVFIDATTGEVLKTFNQICDINATGSGTTRYSGYQEFETDSISPSYFRLRDYSRGGGIETYNAQNYESANLPDSAADFIDFTNTWIVDDSIAKDDAALDVHWGLQESYDYFLGEHGRDSWDGMGRTMIAYVHVGSNWFNARFNGKWMEFGDGTGHPLTSIDVVAHEMTHGVTRTSAGLIYQTESGALNESFSDIFGAEVENFALPGSSDYQIGAENFTFRDMSDPNAFGHPDTYLGTHYYIGPTDNGGVHTNSGVQNFWFYLLSQGGAGINDIGNSYNVTGLGRTVAAQIAYRNLNYYLTPSSQHIDARQGALAAAEDLFGPCSFEVDQVLNAWYAVGVGSDSIDPDLSIISITSPETNCDLTAAEDVTISFRLLKSGCDDKLLPGDSIEVAYTVDGALTQESLILTDTLFGGDSISYTFSSPADLSNNQSYSIDTWVNLTSDSRGTNDTLFGLNVVHPIRVEDEKITFESITPVLDSFYTIMNDHSLIGVAIFGNPGPEGIMGLRMTGDDPDHDSGFEIPTSAIDIWTKNPEYLAKACFCVDATTWTDAHLNFDLKQTFSKWYLQEFGFDLPNQASTMRVSIDGVPISGDYHPDTYISDPYVNHHFDLSAYAGTEFQLCFETMNFVRYEEDTWASSDGDNAYLDNIWIGSQPLDLPERTLNFSVSPNPASQYLEINGHDLSEANITILNATGSIVFEKAVNGNKTRLDLSSFSQGLYLVSISKNGITSTKKVIIQ